MRPVTDSKPPALLVQALSKTYGDGFTAVAGLDLEIPDGAFFGLLGPNGAGKATLIGSVCNIVRPTTSTLTVFGHDHRKAVRLDGCWAWPSRRSTSTGSCRSGRS